MKHRNTPFVRVTAVYLLLNIVLEILAPLIAYALTSGPTQPEFSSFEPVQATNMVDEFSGDFTYNLPVLEVPGPHGSGYAMSLAYHSGASPEEEASWVGYGWTLNPGAINRSVVGIPDDYKGEEGASNNNITQYNKMPSMWTASVGAGANFEITSYELPVGVKGQVSFNNYKGFSRTLGFTAQLGRGLVTLGYSITNGDGSFSMDINPQSLFNDKMKENATRARAFESIAAIGDKKKQTYADAARKLRKANTRMSLAKKTINTANFAAKTVRNIASAQGISSFNSYKGASLHYSLGYIPTPTPVEAGVNVKLYGDFHYQNFDRKQDLKAYGYLYSAEANKGDGGMDLMDFHMEKETPYERRNVFLGVPFSKPDMFSASGLGVGGVFRFYHDQTGQFVPNTVVSESLSHTKGVEVEGGWNIGAGADVSTGVHKLISEPWLVKEGDVFSSRESGGVRPRFTGDMGGYWLPQQYTSNGTVLTSAIFGKMEAPERARIVPFRSFNINEPKLNLASPKVDALPNKFSTGKEAPAASYIHHKTNAEILEAVSENKRSKYEVYTLRSDINELAGRGNSESKHGIGEITVINSGGQIYNYGLPVYNHQEVSMQLGAQKGANFNGGEGFYVYELQGRDDNRIAQGEVKNRRYATTFLLTDVFTSDYIDRTFDGPSDDDFGGYTRFSYTKSDGTYSWRSPYRGFIYERKSLSSKKDDVGFYSEGKKEIYFLETIETKTHVAVFVTENRKDGLSATGDFVTDGKFAPTTNLSARKEMKKLKRIDVYAKSALPDEIILKRSYSAIPAEITPIKSVHFDYADETDPVQELSKGLPNHATKGGKLTLKRVYFTYNGSKIVSSPYRFDYKYSAVNYPAKYKDIQDELKPYVTATANKENPDYTPFNFDAWGNYQLNGKARFAKMQTWLDQAQQTVVYSGTDNQTASLQFDPAAWQLKVVHLPTGGQIHVQYEQDDYAYVQDQAAHAMVSKINSF